MIDSIFFAKAKLLELDANFKKVINPQRTIEVQFNPDSLKVSFANQLQPPRGDESGTQTRQFTGTSTTKLSISLWFDVNAPQRAILLESDVRKLTQKVAYFITPRPADDDRSKLLPPAVRFVWGSFRFDGMMDSMEENLEFFSSEGIPQRASVALSLSQHGITEFAFEKSSLLPGMLKAAVGTRPLVQAASGASLQSIASAAGQGDWQSIAAANGIENPRLLQPGQLLDLNAGRLTGQ